MKHIISRFSGNIHSPIQIISGLSILGGLAYIATGGSITTLGAMWSDGAGITDKIIQFVLYSFLHGGALHTLSNVIFFLFIGRIVEQYYGHKWIWMFWIWTTLFVGTILALFADTPTIGGSGFAMALMVAYTMVYYRAGNPEYKAGVGLIVLNVLLGLYGNVSLLGHLSGAIAGWLFMIFMKRR